MDRTRPDKATASAKGGQLLSHKGESSCDSTQPLLQSPTEWQAEEPEEDTAVYIASEERQELLGRGGSPVSSGDSNEDFFGAGGDLETPRTGLSEAFSRYDSGSGGKQRVSTSQRDVSLIPTNRKSPTSPGSVADDIFGSGDRRGVLIAGRSKSPDLPGSIKADVSCSGGEKEVSRAEHNELLLHGHSGSLGFPKSIEVEVHGRQRASTSPQLHGGDNKDILCSGVSQKTSGRSTYPSYPRDSTRDILYSGNQKRKAKSGRTALPLRSGGTLEGIPLQDMSHPAGVGSRSPQRDCVAMVYETSFTEQTATDNVLGGTGPSTSGHSVSQGQALWNTVSKDRSSSNSGDSVSQGQAQWKDRSSSNNGDSVSQGQAQWKDRRPSNNGDSASQGQAQWKDRRPSNNGDSASQEQAQWKGRRPSNSENIGIQVHAHGNESLPQARSGVSRNSVYVAKTDEYSNARHTTHPSEGTDTEKNVTPGQSRGEDSVEDVQHGTDPPHTPLLSAAAPHRDEVSHNLARYFPDRLDDLDYHSELDLDSPTPGRGRRVRGLGSSSAATSPCQHLDEHLPGSPVSRDGPSYLYTDPEVAARLLQPQAGKHKKPEVVRREGGREGWV